VKLLTAAREASLGPGCPLPEGAVPLIRQAGLQLAMATVAAPIPWQFPWTLRISQRVRNGAVDFDVATIDEAGIVSARADWMISMGSAFAKLRAALVRVERANLDATARTLRGMLFRFGLMFAAVEVIRSTEEEAAVIQAIVAHLDSALKVFV